MPHKGIKPSLHHDKVVETHYAAELDSIRRALVVNQSQEEGVEEKALRLALMTQTGDDALVLRQALAKRLVLELIVSAGSKNISTIAASLSQQLRLPNTISDLYITGIVRTLVDDGMVVDTNGVISVTAAGRESAETVPVEGAAQVLEGREVVREAIKQLSGHSLQTDAFNRFWRRFQDSLASSFYLQASTMVAMVAAITSGVPSSELPEARVLREKIARDSTIDFTSRDQREEVRQAVIDMFSEKDSRAFELNG